MLAFESGHFTRSWKHGYHDWDPVWTTAEKALVNTAVAGILRVLPVLITEISRECANTAALVPILTPDKVFIVRIHLWFSRLGKISKMFSDMQTDLGAGGKKIVLRKATDLDTADEISALCEFMGKTPRWVISLNGNAADTKCHFFAKANAAKSTRSLFHELTHLYGTEDKGVIDLENAHVLESLIGGRAAPALRALLAKQREFTMLGDRGRRARGLALSLPRLQAIYGVSDCWDRKGFANNFTGDPVNGLVTRKSDAKQGTISIVWDAQNRPLYYYNFK